jgi:CheY-like chemotaxis protein
MRYGDGPVDVLLVEDRRGDVRLTKEAFHRHGLVSLHHVWDGVAAMAFLRREGVYVNAPWPDLIIIDLNLPKMDGREALRLIKSDSELKSILTIVLKRVKRKYTFRCVIGSARAVTYESPRTGMHSKIS